MKTHILASVLIVLAVAVSISLILNNNAKSPPEEPQAEQSTPEATVAEPEPEPLPSPESLPEPENIQQVLGEEQAEEWEASYENTSYALVTGKKDELQQVIIIEDPNYQGKNAKTVISDMQTMNALYDAVASVDTIANEYPNHIESLQFDSDYDVVFIFPDTEETVIIHFETAYRQLETRGSSGDPGYVRGDASKILEVIKTAQNIIDSN